MPPRKPKPQAGAKQPTESPNKRRKGGWKGHGRERAGQTTGRGEKGAGPRRQGDPEPPTPHPGARALKPGKRPRGATEAGAPEPEPAKASMPPRKKHPAGAKPPSESPNVKRKGVRGAEKSGTATLPAGDKEAPKGPRRQGDPEPPATHQGARALKPGMRARGATEASAPELGFPFHPLTTPCTVCKGEAGKT